VEHHNIDGVDFLGTMYKDAAYHHFTPVLLQSFDSMLIQRAHWGIIIPILILNRSHRLVLHYGDE